MRALWTAFRVAVALVALFTMTVTVFWVGSPSGTSIDPQGAFVDVLALSALILAAVSLWRDRARLF